jgi:5-formyltetrahydrofolate cyclo-ligase
MLNTKYFLRKEGKKQRELLTNNEINQKSKAIFNLFWNLIDKNKKSLGHIFIPIESKKEINTLILLEEIWKHYPHIQTFTSCIDWENNDLLHVEINQNTTFKKNKWEISEPEINDKTHFLNPFLLDWVLVPLLAFDEKGYRVGYGKGFYDKFLSLCKPEVKKIGVHFFSPVTHITDVEIFDIQLNSCITPQKIYIFEK